MSLVTYNRLDNIDKVFNKLLLNNGISEPQNAPFLNQLIEALKDATSAPYSVLYEIADNIDISRAKGEYLLRHGKFLNTYPTLETFATDLSLSNLEIYIDSGKTAGELTIDGEGITIKGGTRCYSFDNTYSVVTLDDVVIPFDKSSVFVRCMAERSGNITIMENKITEIDLPLSNIPNIMPSAIGTDKLKCKNHKTITGGTSIADDDTYRYILLQAANSIGLSNKHKINMLYKIEEIADIVYKEFYGGITVFISTKDPDDVENILPQAQRMINAELNFGVPVYCFSPIMRNLKLTIYVSLQGLDYFNTIKDNLATEIAKKINNTKIGAQIDIQAIVNDTLKSTTGVISGSIYEGKIDNRTLLGTSVALNYNERLVCTKEDIEIRI